MEENNVYYNVYLVLCSIYSTPPYDNDTNYYSHFWRFLDSAHGAWVQNEDLSWIMVVWFEPLSALSFLTSIPNHPFCTHMHFFFSIDHLIFLLPATYVVLWNREEGCFIVVMMKGLLEQTHLKEDWTRARMHGA